MFISVGCRKKTYMLGNICAWTYFPVDRKRFHEHTFIRNGHVTFYVTGNEMLGFIAIMNNYEQTDTIISSIAFTKIKILTNLFHVAYFPTALWPHP